MPTSPTAVARAATRTSPAARMRAVALAAAALAVALGITLAGGAPAFAHDELIGSSPEPGEVFDAAPAEVSLTFSGAVIEAGTAVVVVDHHGEEIEVGAPVIAGSDVTAALPADLAGDYQVRWRVVSSDGHPIEGAIDFGVGADATGTWTEEAPHDDAPVDSAATSESEQAEDTAATGPDGWTIAGFVIGALGILALAAALIVAARRRSAGPGAGPGGSDGSADQ
ncbi:copper resistance CopC family protein [Agromyces humatus]|uniref:CopC domain-containing protein n=1 Tax=Agromyces humatus TaxID=279573 RepID=A0ABP4WQ65_9MICO|nr:copper resistance CopC family protein [Agromyces humatus]